MQAENNAQRHIRRNLIQANNTVLDRLSQAAAIHRGDERRLNETLDTLDRFIETLAPVRHKHLLLYRQ